MRQCVLQEKLCEECGRCNYCDINKNKICDNCCECVEGNSTKTDYKILTINEIEEVADYSFNKKEQKLYFDWLQEKYRDKNKIN
ncbi:hypothetical protein NSA47_03630 [Irregularibacter muris]|uniref:Uncharacterized protein n=1 Tax=Irregularibacter muris TaxID=1796619 RepID=A0AAE3HD08_9FIRM|nr:hypothetical protein [Irregularibacter muris]MCR1898077.1 hypothetical protein [Irregularibacter muris]